MGTQFLIDTNAIIEFLGAKLPPSGSQWVQRLFDQNLLHLSVINKIELLGFNGSPSEMQVLEDFIRDSIFLPVSEQVVDTTILLRKAYRIKLPDAIIAATALTFDLTVITRNTADFKAINGLSAVNAHDI